MKKVNLKFAVVFTVLFVLVISSMEAKNKQASVLFESESVILVESDANGSNADFMPVDSEIEIESLLLIEATTSCTVKVKIGFLGLGGSVSATAPTCDEARKMIAAILKK